MKKDDKNRMELAKLYFDSKVRRLVRQKDLATIKSLGFSNLDNDVEIVIVESTKDVFYLALPSVVLSPEEFRQVSAGVDHGSAGTAGSVGSATTFSTVTSSIGSASTLASVGTAGTAGCGD